MFVQTFATVRSCIPPFRTCYLFEPNCAHHFSEAAEGRAGRRSEGAKGREGCEDASRAFKAPPKVMLLQLTDLEHKNVDPRTPHGKCQLPHNSSSTAAPLQGHSSC